MHLDLDPATSQQLDAEAASLLGLAEAVDLAERERRPALGGSLVEVQADVHLVAGEGIERLGPMTAIASDGTLASVEFTSRTGLHRLSADGCRLADELAGRIVESEEVERKLGFEWVREHLLRWLERFANGSSTGKAWTEELCEEADDAVREHSFWVPLRGLHIERDFEVGRVGVSFFSLADAQRIASQMAAPAREDNDRVSSRRAEVVEELAGQVYARTTVEGTSRRARTTAMALVDEALDLLRFFNPGAADPFSRVTLGRTGTVVETTTTYGHYNADGTPCLPSGELHASAMPWHVSKREWQRMLDMGMARLTKIAAAGPASPFEADLIVAIRTYSRGLLLPDPEDRFLHAVMAAEAMWVRTGEGKSRALRERLAWVLGQHGRSAPKVQRDVKDAYDRRSRFVHEGHRLTPADLQAAKDSLGHLWTGVALCAAAQPEITTKREHLRRVDLLAGR